MNYEVMILGGEKHNVQADSYEVEDNGWVHFFVEAEDGRNTTVASFQHVDYVMFSSSPRPPCNSPPTVYKDLDDLDKSLGY